MDYKIGKNNVVADQLSRPVRIIQGSEDGTWLGRSRDEIQGLQREELRWREMIDYLEGERIPGSKYPRATLDQFAVENGILYLCKQKNRWHNIVSINSAERIKEGRLETDS